MRQNPEENQGLLLHPSNTKYKIHHSSIIGNNRLWTKVLIALLCVGIIVVGWIFLRNTIAHLNSNETSSESKIHNRGTNKTLCAGEIHGTNQTLTGSKI